MPRRTPKRKAKGRPAARNHSASRCRALVLVDGTAIRKKIRKGYEKARRDLERAQQQLDHFLQKDLPQFTRWLNTHFGALLTELRELNQQVAADEELIFEVESEVLLGGVSHASAYRRVMEFRENPQPPPPTGEDEWDREDASRGGPKEAETGDCAEDLFEAFLNEVFDDWEPRDERRDPGASSGPHRPEEAEPGQKTTRLKELYRAVVRRLHPDRQTEMTAQKIEWWHQAQAANEAGDVEQLEVILTLCEIGDTGTTAHTSASLLHRITAQLKNSLREIKRQLTGRRRDPAWNFSQRSDLDTLAEEIRFELNEDLAHLRHQYHLSQEVIGRWKAGAARLKKRPRRRRRTAANMEFPF